MLHDLTTSWIYASALWKKKKEYTEKLLMLSRLFTGQIRIKEQTCMKLHYSSDLVIQKLQQYQLRSIKSPPLLPSHPALTFTTFHLSVALVLPLVGPGVNWSSDLTQSTNRKERIKTGGGPDWDDRTGAQIIALEQQMVYHISGGKEDY